MSQELKYMSGFGNHFSTEAEEGALPVGQNNPQHHALGLYTEQLSGTAFTVPRADNQRTWVYRIRPSVGHKKVGASVGQMGEDIGVVDPQQLRWRPFALADDATPTDFVQGLRCAAGAGDPQMRAGLRVYWYACNASMKDKAFCNSDGDFLIVPQLGALTVRTELGVLHVAPGEICVVQRGIRYSVEVEGSSRGYVCEVFDGHLKLPDLGPIGSNGLANPRDFQTPVAAYEDRDCSFVVVQKFCSKLFEVVYDHSVFDVVGWHGNYAPYKYDLSLFNTMNSVSFDHPDPSIYTVLTLQSNTPGVAVLDFVIFPPRWCVMEHSFRPPWPHRNIATEFMGLISGSYDAKEGEGFSPGGASLHSAFMAHGPDVKAYDKAAAEDTSKPAKIPEGSLAFMFETNYTLTLAPEGDAAAKDEAYVECWAGFPNHFRELRK